MHNRYSHAFSHNNTKYWVLYFNVNLDRETMVGLGDPDHEFVNEFIPAGRLPL